ncbi:ubiquitin-like [Tenrec ecaudatus]|uniref:ubiquitin-like n=1 Tax=Tenrec ecaudatus TaxID=94439 RepID=UPI003F599B05
MNFQVSVTGPQGKKVVVDVADSEQAFKQTTVKILMALVFKQLNLKESEDCTLLFADQRLETGKTLQDYAIRNKSSLIMVLQLPGGA